VGKRASIIDNSDINNHRRNTMSPTPPLTRRAFNRTVAASAVGLPYWLDASARAAAPNGAPSPNDRINIGVIGHGMMGRGHLRDFLRYPDARVVAVCDVDRWRRDDGKAVVEGAYAAGRKSGQYRGCAAYVDLRELLARPDIDAVLIATGDRWHAAATVLAAEAGKDIYCEKPISLTIGEGRTMVDVARRFGRVFQTGLQQRSTPEFRKTVALIRRGRLGKITHCYVRHPGTCYPVTLPPQPVPEGLDWELWLGPAPWRPYNRRYHPYGKPMGVVPWHFCPDFGGGNLTSNTVHALDVVQWGLDADATGPVEIIPPETGLRPVLTYRYACGAIVQVGPRLDPAKQHVPEGWDPRTEIQPFGVLFVGTEGWIHVGRGGFLESHPAEIAAEDVPESRGLTHRPGWLHAIRTRTEPTAPVEIGHRSTTVSHLGCLAHRLGRRLQWNPAHETFIGDDQANRLRYRTPRPPWRI
jgi:hypothetical protein